MVHCVGAVVDLVAVAAAASASAYLTTTIMDHLN
jgi:hypothetical protein